MNQISGKTILVTGSSGFVGSHLMHRLLEEQDVRLLLVSRQPPTVVLQGVEWINSSLTQLTPATWKSRGIETLDLVFHLAGFTPKKADEANKTDEIYRDNLLGTRLLLESLPPGLERIIFTSTLDVYALQPDDVILNESSTLDPTSLYGASKLFCEYLIRAYARERECEYVNLRYGHIFGPGEEAYSKLIPQMIRNLLKGKPPVLYGDGSAERDFLYINDAIEATIRAGIVSKKDIGPINIVRGNSCKIRDIVKLLIEIVGFPGRIQFLSEKQAGHSLRFDNRKMREVLGEWELTSLKEGLRQETEYFKELSQNDE